MTDTLANLETVPIIIKIKYTYLDDGSHQNNLYLTLHICHSCLLSDHSIQQNQGLL